MNRELLISMTTVLGLMKMNQKIEKELTEEYSSNLEPFVKGMASGIETTSKSYESLMNRLEYLVNEALKGEGLDYLIEDVNLDGMKELFK